MYNVVENQLKSILHDERKRDEAINSEKTGVVLVMALTVVERQCEGGRGERGGKRERERRRVSDTVETKGGKGFEKRYRKKKRRREREREKENIRLLASPRRAP